MITDIELTNFRRHASSRITCTPGEQIIAIGGSNGAGKSTIFEAVEVALFGETRKGSYIDRVVRRGAELEGMEVAVGFTIGEETYRVVRRRDGKASSALLQANGITLVEGVRAVEKAVQEVIGTDALGWRLATYARQKELDALTKLGDKARETQISRLLRLDALSRAGAAARSTFRAARDVVDALGVEDPDAIKRDIEAATEQLLAMQASEADAEKTIAELQARIADAAETDRFFNEANLQRERAAGRLAEIEATVSRLTSERSKLTDSLEDLPEGTDNIDDLTRQGHELDLSIQRAETRRRENQLRISVTAQLEEVEARIKVLDEGDAEFGDAATLDELIKSAEKTREHLSSNVDELIARRESLLDEHASLRATATSASESAALADELAGVCDRCGQDVDQTTREHLVATRQSEADRANEELRAAHEAGSAVSSKLVKARADLDACSLQAEKLEQQRSDAAGRAGERSALTRQRNNFVAQLGRLSEHADDLDQLLEQRGRVAAQAGIAEAYEERRAQQVKTQERIAALGKEILDQEKLRDDAAAAVERLGPDKALSEAVAALRIAEEQHRNELSLLGDLKAASAAAQERVTAHQQRYDDVSQRGAVRQRHMDRALAAEGAGRLLADVSQHLSAQVKPSLEGAVSDLLAQLSDGRFTSLTLGSNYECLVDDGGASRKVEDLSGGEGDLVALAFRLGLSELVAARSGGGLGVLVLDEVLGSQDHERRQTIMSTLRGLRGRYQQIWSISHVGGVEDAADRVINVDVDDDGIAHLDG